MAPLMHGAASGPLNVLYMGGTSVLYCERAFDPVGLWRLAEREQCISLLLVGDAVFSTAVKEQLRELLPDLNVADSYGGLGDRRERH